MIWRFEVKRNLINDEYSCFFLDILKIFKVVIYKIMIVYSLFLYGELNILYVIVCNIIYFNVKFNLFRFLEIMVDYDMYDIWYLFIWVC